MRAGAALFGGGGFFCGARASPRFEAAFLVRSVDSASFGFSTVLFQSDTFDISIGRGSKV
jgi:hypothetical protein